jgi:hypothetical protein
MNEIIHEKTNTFFLHNTITTFDAVFGGTSILTASYFVENDLKRINMTFCEKKGKSKRERDRERPSTLSSLC